MEHDESKEPKKNFLSPTVIIELSVVLFLILFAIILAVKNNAPAGQVEFSELTFSTRGNQSFVSFHVHNHRPKNAFCTFVISTELGVLSTQNNITVPSAAKKDFLYPVDLPNGDSPVELDARCTFT